MNNRRKEGETGAKWNFAGCRRRSQVQLGNEEKKRMKPMRGRRSFLDGINKINGIKAGELTGGT
jgi:hypothetical protein